MAKKRFRIQGTDSMIHDIRKMAHRNAMTVSSSNNFAVKIHDGKLVFSLKESSSKSRKRATL